MKSCLKTASMVVALTACSSTEPSPPPPTPTGQLLVKFHTRLLQVDAATGVLEELPFPGYGRTYVHVGVRQRFGPSTGRVLGMWRAITPGQSAPVFIGLVNSATGAIDTLAFMPNLSYHLMGYAPDGTTPLISETRNVIYRPDPATRTLVPYWTAPEGVAVIAVGSWFGGLVAVLAELGGERRDFVAIDPATGGWTAMGNPPQLAGYPAHVAVSPDGKMLAAGTWGDEVQMVYTDGRLVPHGTFTGRCPVFSPDGRFLAYATPEEDGRQTHQRLMILRLSDGHTWNYRHQHDFPREDHCPQDWIE